MAEQIAKLYAEIGADISGLKRGLNQAENALEGTKRAVLGLGIALTGALAGAGLMQAGFELDKTMRNIRAVTGKTAAEMATLTGEIAKLGSNSTIGLQATADAFYDVAGGVDDASKHMGILQASLALAEAGQASMQTATQGLISVMNAYGDSAGSATTVSDVFTRTVGLGVGTMDEFVSAMSPIAGVMKNAGIEFQDLGYMMAFMTKKGVPASQAASRLQQAVVSILKPNKAMAEGLKKIGIESGSAALKQYGLAGVLGRLGWSVNNSTDAMAEMVGSVEALSAATILNGPDLEEFIGLFEDGMKGATAAARALQLESPSAKIEIFLNQLKGAGAQIGQAAVALLGTALSVVPQIIQDLWTNNFLGIPKAVESAVAALAKPFEALRSAVSEFFDNIFNPKKTDPGDAWFKQFGQRFSKEKMDVLVGGEEIGPTLGERIQKAVEAVGPKIMAALANLGNSIKGWFVSTFQISPEMLKTIEALLKPLKEAFDNLAEVNWGNIALAAAPLLGLAAGIGALGGAMTLLKNVAVFWLLTEFLKVLSDSIDVLKVQGIGPALEAVGKGLLSIPADAAVGLGNLLGIDVKAGITAFQEGIDKIPIIIDEIRKKLEQAWTDISNTVSAAVAPIGKAFNDIATAIDNALRPILTFIQQVIDKIKEFLGISAQAKAETLGPPVPAPAPAPPPVPTVPKATGMGGAAAAAANARIAAAYEEWKKTHPGETNPKVRAAGGPVSTGRAYLVGERGPELFSPFSAGRIIPNRAISGGGQVTINLVANGINNPIALTNMIQAELKRRNA